MVERQDGAQLHDLIDKYSFEKYYVKYHSFQVNHMAHAQIALFRLGAPISLIETFSEYLATTKLEKKGGPLNEKQDAAIEKFDSVEDLKGRCGRYYVIYDHFKDLFESKYDSNLDDFINEEFGKLKLGIGRNVLHPLIHIGYGYSVRSAQVVIEGMAFLFLSYFPLEVTKFESQKLGKGDKSLEEVAVLLQDDKDLYNKMITESQNDWANKLKILALLRTCGDKFLEYVHMLDCPNEPESLMNWILDKSIAVYQMSENPNDFFLLHGATCAWSLSTILPLIKSKDEALEILQTFLCVLLMVYETQAAPKLLAERLENPDVSSLTWDAIIEKCFGMAPEGDEHIYKMVQVCYETSLLNPAQSDLYKRASLTSMDHKFYR